VKIGHEPRPWRDVLPFRSVQLNSMKGVTVEPRPSNRHLKPHTANRIALRQIAGRRNQLFLVTQNLDVGVKEY